MHRTNNSIDETIKKGDSLELLYTNDRLFNITTDTLPLFADENSSWKDWMRDLQVVKFLYDSSNVLKKVSFANGRKGTYYFYFEGTYLRKVRVLYQGGLINLQYYFTIQDNWFTFSEIDQRITSNPENKELYELLKTGKDFFYKFKTHL